MNDAIFTLLAGKRYPVSFGSGLQHLILEENRKKSIEKKDNE